MKRTLILVGLFALLALTPGAALAKMPPYSVDVTPSDPTAGESIRVTVRFWNDAEHTRWVLCSDGGAIWCPGGRRIAGYESRKGFTVANAPAPPPTVSPGDSADPETPRSPSSCTAPGVRDRRVGGRRSIGTFPPLLRR